MKFTLNEETIDSISKAITQYAFRSGPIEKMHTNNQLSQKDMKALNKYMVNRIAGLLTTISKGDIANILKARRLGKTQQKLDKVMFFILKIFNIPVLSSQTDCSFTVSPDSEGIELT